MINAKGFTAVVCCDNCLKELSKGPYPADAEDNLPTDCILISHDEEKENEHYCADCKRAKEEEEIEEMDDVLGVCRQFIKDGNVSAAVKHFQTEMKCSEDEAHETVGLQSIFYKCVHELQD